MHRCVAFSILSVFSCCHPIDSFAVAVFRKLNINFMHCLPNVHSQCRFELMMKIILRANLQKQQKYKLNNFRKRIYRWVEMNILQTTPINTDTHTIYKKKSQHYWSHNKSALRIIDSCTLFHSTYRLCDERFYTPPCTFQSFLFIYFFLYSFFFFDFISIGWRNCFLSLFFTLPRSFRFFCFIYTCQAVLSFCSMCDMLQFFFTKKRSDFYQINI